MATMACASNPRLAPLFACSLLVFACGDDKGGITTSMLPTNLGGFDDDDDDDGGDGDGDATATGAPPTGETGAPTTGEPPVDSTGDVTAATDPSTTSPTNPTTDPSTTNGPTSDPSSDPTNDPSTTSTDPTNDPTNDPSSDPTNDPTNDDTTGGVDPYAECIAAEGQNACTECLCTDCIVEYSACQEDAGCKEIRDCALESGCLGFDCLEVCGPVIEEHGGFGSPSSTLALTLSMCVESSCAGLCG